jgi:hypothetical protein
VRGRAGICVISLAGLTAFGLLFLLARRSETIRGLAYLLAVAWFRWRG